MNLADLLMGRIRKCLATLRVLLARVVLLENGEVIKRLIYKFIVCEFRGFKNVLHDVSILRHPYIDSLLTLSYKMVSPSESCA